MHIIELLHKNLKKELPSVHKVRLESLMAVTATATCSNKLYLTGLGRELLNQNKTSSNIQKVDRLLSNECLQSERTLYYKVMISKIIKEDSRPWIIVDWTCINSITNLYALRASVSMSGRSIVIYEESHPKKKEGNPTIHKLFLEQLKTLLPKSVKPIIISDAGFRTPWFMSVLKLGWDFVGRLRGKNQIKIRTESIWKLSNIYFEKATETPTYIGSGMLTTRKKLLAHFVLYRGKNKGRKVGKSKQKNQSSKNKRYSKGHKEPLMLVTSLESASVQPIGIANIYRQRMRIEENIRDTKCPYYGLGLKKSLTQCAKRMNILLLIAALATFAAWLGGLFTITMGKAADFQAHSAKFTTVLSTVFLGREALKKGIQMTRQEFKDTLLALYQATIAAQQETHHYG